MSDGFVNATAFANASIFAYLDDIVIGGKNLEKIRTVIRHFDKWRYIRLESSVYALEHL